jgi:hypothetical protein
MVIAKMNVLSTQSVCVESQDRGTEVSFESAHGVCAGEVRDSNHRTDSVLVEPLFVNV